MIHPGSSPAEESASSRGCCLHMNKNVWMPIPTLQFICKRILLKYFKSSLSQGPKSLSCLHSSQFKLKEAKQINVDNRSVLIVAMYRQGSRYASQMPQHKKGKIPSKELPPHKIFKISCVFQKCMSSKESLDFPQNANLNYLFLYNCFPHFSFSS